MSSAVRFVVDPFDRFDVDPIDLDDFTGDHHHEIHRSRNHKDDGTETTTAYGFGDLHQIETKYQSRRRRSTVRVTPSFS